MKPRISAAVTTSIAGRIGTMNRNSMKSPPINTMYDDQRAMKTRSCPMAGSLLSRDPAMGQLLVFIALWSSYIVLIGGDFMEFRFMVPILPAMLVVTAALIRGFIADSRIALAL